MLDDECFWNTTNKDMKENETEKANNKKSKTFDDEKREREERNENV